MAKFTLIRTSIRVEPLLDLDKITARQPTRKLNLVDNNLVFNFSYISSKNKRKNSAWIIGEAMKGTKIVAHNSNKAHRVISYLPFLVIGSLSFSIYVVAVAALITKLLQIPKSILFEHKPEENNRKPQKTTSASIKEDLFSTLDAYTLENFVFSMCVLLAWWILARFGSFCSKDDRI